MKTCDCNERIGTKIRSLEQFNELKSFFDTQVANGVFVEVKPKKPFYIGYDHDGTKYTWYATRWLVCSVCGCLWEFDYPDFPAIGFVRKFSSEKDYKGEDEEL